MELLFVIYHTCTAYVYVSYCVCTSHMDGYMFDLKSVGPSLLPTLTVDLQLV